MNLVVFSGPPSSGKTSVILKTVDALKQHVKPRHTVLLIQPKKAREVIRQALAEKQTELDEIDRLKQSREDFRAEYRKLLQHFLDDADSVFPETVLTNNVPTGSQNAAQPAAQQTQVSVPAPAAGDFNDLD